MHTVRFGLVVWTFGPLTVDRGHETQFMVHGSQVSSFKPFHARSYSTSRKQYKNSSRSKKQGQFTTDSAIRLKVSLKL